MKKKQKKQNAYSKECSASTKTTNNQNRCIKNIKDINGQKDVITDCKTGSR